MTGVVGWVGLGIMGRAMVGRLLNRGIRVHVFSRSLVLSDDIVPRVIGHRSARQLGSVVRMVFLTLPDGPACDEVLFGSNGVAEGMTPGSLVVNLSTVGPDWAGHLAARLEAFDIDYLDAPVIGSQDAAEAGRLVVLAGGEALAINRVQPIFELLAAETMMVGPVGAASSVKLVVNAMLGMTMAAFADVISLADSMGIDRAWVFDVLPGLPVSAPFLKGKAEALKRGDASAAFPLEWMAKDLDLALNNASAHGTDTPHLRGAAHAFRNAANQGLGRRDFSALAAVR